MKLEWSRLRVLLGVKKNKTKTLLFFSLIFSTIALTLLQLTATSRTGLLLHRRIHKSRNEIFFPFVSLLEKTFNLFKRFGSRSNFSNRSDSEALPQEWRVNSHSSTNPGREQFSHPSDKYQICALIKILFWYLFK